MKSQLLLLLISTEEMNLTDVDQQALSFTHQCSSNDRNISIHVMNPAKKYFSLKV